MNQDKLGIQAHRVSAKGSDLQDPHPTQATFVQACDAKSELQQWELTASNRIRHVPSGRCLQADDSEAVTLTDSCQSNSARQFRVDESGSVVDSVSGKCLTGRPLPSALHKPARDAGYGTFLVELQPCSPERALQQWKWDDSAGRLQLRAPASLLCLTMFRDVPPGREEVWSGPLDGGDFVVLMLNRGSQSASIRADWSDINIPTSRPMMVRDLWAKKDLGTFTDSFSATVESHGIVMLRLHAA